MEFNKKVFLAGTGFRLRTLRRRVGYTATEMARRMGMSAAGYRKYESGECFLSPVSLKYLSREYHVSMDWLLFEIGPMLVEREKLEQGAAESVQQMMSADVKTRPVNHQKPEIREMVSHMETDPLLYHRLMLSFYSYLQEKAEKG